MQPFQSIGFAKAVSVKGGKVSVNPHLWNWTGRHQLTCPKNMICCSCTSSLCPFHPVIYHWTSSICLEISQHHSITLKKVQQWIPLIGAKLSYCTSNHQQGHGIHHCSWRKIIIFLWQPHLTSIQIQTWSLYLGHAASTLTTMDGGHQYQTWDQGYLSGHISSIWYSLASCLALQTVCRWNPRPTTLLDYWLPPLS